jgi:hypothetical protein
MSYFWFLIFSCSIFIGATIGLVRFQKIAPAFYPVIYCIWIGSVNEILSIIFPRIGLTTAVNNNIYVLIECILIIWQLQKWGAFAHHPKIFTALIIMLSLVWTFEHWILFTIKYPQPYFRILYSFIIVLLSIHVNNRVMLFEKNRIYKNPVFLFCLGFIIYFTYKVLVEVFWLYGLHASVYFRINIYSILTWINLIANLIYAAALLWIPKKQPFIRLS